MHTKERVVPVKIITISDGRGTQAVIAPDKGATVISLTRDGEEFLYCNEENLQSPERPRCGIPFLFPIFGRLQDGQYTYDGKSYAMEIHGFGHLSRWNVAEQGSDYVRLVLEANDETLAIYPFRFRTELCFRVCDGALSIEQRYENLDAKPMPYNFGFHPYFRVEKLEHASVESTAETYFDFTVGKPQPLGHGTVSVSIPEGAPETGAVLMKVQSPTILHIPEEGRRVTMEFDESFPQHVLWTQAGKEFLCVEPINGTANGLNTGVHLTLQPGEVKETTLRILAEQI